MINRKFVASQLKKLATKVEGVYSSEAEAKEIYDFLVEKTFKKNWGKKFENHNNWGKIILLPSDGSENAKTQKIIRENIAEHIKWEYEEMRKDREKYESEVEKDPSKKDKDLEKKFRYFFERYGSSSEEWIKTIMKNNRIINYFFDDPELGSGWEDHLLMGDDWDINSPLKKYTLVVYSDWTWWVETYSSARNVMLKLERYVGQDNWEVLWTDEGLFYQ